MEFTLEATFVESYASKNPPWGFPGLSELTNRRTYSRPKENGEAEEWYEIVERVVNCSFSMQKKHCDEHKISWDSETQDTLAQKMYDAIFYMRFSPPGMKKPRFFSTSMCFFLGRGLWANTSKILHQKSLYAALNNCGFTSTEDIDKTFSAPFRFAMDNSMLGVGIGFDVNGAGKIKIQQPNLTEREDLRYGRFEGVCYEDLYKEFCEFGQQHHEKRVGTGSLYIQKANSVVLEAFKNLQQFVELDQFIIHDHIPLGENVPKNDFRHFATNMLMTLNCSSHTNDFQTSTMLIYTCYLINMFCQLHKDINKLRPNIQGQEAKTLTEFYMMFKNGQVYDWSASSYYYDMCNYLRELVYMWLNLDVDFQIFRVPDTREGWVEATGLLLDSYLKPKQRQPVLIDYTLVREKGIQLKTFGGLSSGPDPLCDLHIMLRRLFEGAIGKLLTATMITDIMNYIGKCVVAGNVRRSSEIALGPPGIYFKERLFSKNLSHRFTRISKFEKLCFKSGKSKVGLVQ